ncbi:MAG TPA: FixH family protein [Chitinophagaceae bacterium]|nr:FixH family protein [Chitinophagaceae bacterium]
MKKHSPLQILCCLLLVSITYMSCKKDAVAEPDPAAGLIKQSEGYAIGAATKVEIYTESGSITTGYNKFYIALYDSVSGIRIDRAALQLTPMMDMGTMQHSAPFENPTSENASNHLFACSVVFIMPSGSGQNWTLSIQVSNLSTNKNGTLTVPVTVTEPAHKTMNSFTSAANGGKYFISLVQPAKPKVGINDFEVVVYKKISMMNFPPDSSMSITLYPEMPTMGHSSPNNVDPVHISQGHYKGNVNFTMTGLWRLHLRFMAGESVADTTQYFDVEF